MFTVTKRKMPTTIESFFDSQLFNLGKFEDSFKDFKIKSQIVKTNVINEEDYQEIHMSIPGVEKEFLNISLEDYILTVSFKNEKEEIEKSKNFYLKEFSINSFERSFSLSKNSDIDKITSRYENGILYINIPEKKEKKNKNRVVKID